MILNEIQEVGALGQSATLIRVWSCFRAALFVLCILCCFLLQGCEGYDDEYDAFEILIWSFASRVYANPVPSVCILIAMWLLPCVYACIACCTSRKQVIEVKICGDAKDVHKSCANNERDDEAQASSDGPRSPPRPERSEPATFFCCCTCELTKFLCRHSCHQACE